MSCKLNYSQQRLSDEELEQRFQCDFNLREDAEFPFEEVDLSQNSLTSNGMQTVLDVCRRCPNLKVLKLYRNQIGDQGAQKLAELCGVFAHGDAQRKPQVLQELHLSHNHFTVVGVETLVSAAHGRPDDVIPLWLRLEQNEVSDVGVVYRSLERRFNVCDRQEANHCTVRVCCKRAKVHLPHFGLQKEIRQHRPAAKCGVAATASSDRSSARSCENQVEGVANINANIDISKNLKDKAGRDSAPMDSHGRRRILPLQMESDNVDNSQFACPLCEYVTIRPILTRCSHLFCDFCFRDWVRQQVVRRKSDNGDGPVPLLPCPRPDCQEKLRKHDVMSLEKASASNDDSKLGAVHLLQRLRNNITVRCVHHKDHFQHQCGKDAQHVSCKFNTTCNWTGDLNSYEEHIQEGCKVEEIIEGGKDSKSDKDSNATCSTEDGFYEVANEGEVRVVRYDYHPRTSDSAYLALKANDVVKLLTVIERGWAAGVKLKKDSLQEVGDAGWFPASFLHPPNFKRECPAVR